MRRGDKPVHAAIKNTPKIDLSQVDMPAFLRELGLAGEDEAVAVEELPGGVSSLVLKVTLGEHRWIVKQALPKLKVEADWYCDPSRNLLEAKAIRLFSSFLPEGSVPKIVYHDPESFFLIMTCGPEGAVTWKEELLAGKVNLTIARKLAAILAEIHNRTAGNEQMRRDFNFPELFYDGRLDPYFVTLQPMYPDLAGRLGEVVEKCLHTSRCLTTVDFSPKNHLVKGDEVMIIDHEGCHYGDPAFDNAFFLNHLFLKSIHNPHMRERYFEAIRLIWSIYAGAIRYIDPGQIERETVEMLGPMMLARADGKSKAEYLRERDKEVIRELSRVAILERLDRLEQLIDLTGRHLARRSNAGPGTGTKGEAS